MSDFSNKKHNTNMTHNNIKQNPQRHASNRHTTLIYSNTTKKTYRHIIITTYNRHTTRA